MIDDFAQQTASWPWRYRDGRANPAPDGDSGEVKPLTPPRPLVVEAGLAPVKPTPIWRALRAKKKVIISTGSKALQDQLYSATCRPSLKHLNSPANWRC